MSWFPKASTWNGSGYRSACWTSEAERWFQETLKRIFDRLAANESPTLSQNDWKVQLRRRRGITVMNNLEEVSKALI